jgi:hypothetical protein
MKLLITLMLFFCSILSFSQEGFFNKNYFKDRLFDINVFTKKSLVFNSFIYNVSDNIVDVPSILLIDENRYKHLNTKIQFQKLPDMTLEEKMNYEDMYFGCMPSNSQDLMMSAIKDYILNKYVLSLFLNTPYN